MGMQIDRRPIDPRLLENDDFYEYFLEATEQEQTDELDADNIGELMRDSEYIDSLYEKYKGEKGAE